MKRVIFVVLMIAMIPSPCLAEGEPDSILSVEKTLWEGIALFPPHQAGQSVIPINLAFRY